MTQNQIEVSLGRSLRQLRSHEDVRYSINNQITFWHVVEDLRHTFERNNPKFKGSEFIGNVMTYAGIGSTDIPQEDWFLELARPKDH